MKHLRYFLLAALVAMPLTACDEDSDPVIEEISYGTVAGTVSAEGTGLAGVSVTLVGAVSQSASTGAGGTYAFANVPAGSYGVSIDASTHTDVSFSQVSKSTTITMNGETATVDFSGSYIKTAAITGLVTSSGAPLGGVAVKVTGGPGNITDNSVTSAGGEYRATGLRKGTYTVTITPPAGTNFTTVAAQVTVATGETRTAHFPGTAIQLATISGAVTVDNIGRAGVAVALTGGATKATETGAGGAYSFANLTPGLYTVTITAPEKVTFPALSKGVTVAAGENGIVNFAGKGPDEPATISIKSITTGAGVPVVLTNVNGQVEVSLNITRGDKALDKVDVVFKNAAGTPIVLATQKFAVPPAPVEAAAGDQEVVTLNVPTNQIRMGTNTYVPVIFNGKANISANLWEVGAAAPIPTNEVPVVMTNVDVLMTSNGAMIPGV
ncbi:MAG: carboxypeptidase-like regulatory domain-containing protein, partial [Gemmatimonadota bacterium]